MYLKRHLMKGADREEQKKAEFEQFTGICH